MPTYLGLTSGIMGYFSMLLVLSGIWIMFRDGKTYRERGMTRLQRYAEIIGPLYVLGGILLTIGGWIYIKWFW